MSQKGGEHLEGKVHPNSCSVVLGEEVVYIPACESYKHSMKQLVYFEGR